MTGKKFVWLRDSAFPRTGPKLEKGKEHDAANYPAEVVEEWIKSGAAQEVREPGVKDQPVKRAGKRGEK